MIGVVLVSHENIAKEMLNVIKHIVGPQENLIAISKPNPWAPPVTTAVLFLKS